MRLGLWQIDRIVFGAGEEALLLDGTECGIFWIAHDGFFASNGLDCLYSYDSA